MLSYPPPLWLVLGTLLVVGFIYLVTRLVTGDLSSGCLGLVGGWREKLL
jgi:hypothetical protein